MKTITETINAKGGLEHLKTNPIRIDNPGYMMLCIEHIGEQHGFDVISVAHYGEQNGDLMRDPDMTFAVAHDLKTWLPLSFRNDYAGVEQETTGTNDETGKQWVKLGLVRELEAFAKEWDKNIREQGFLEIANGAETRSEESK